MKTLTLIFFLMFSLNALADGCFLTKERDQRGDLLVKCTKGFTPKNVICRAPIKQGRFVVPEIVTRDSEGTELSRRPYSLGDTVDPEKRERIECSVDREALEADRQEKQQERQAEQARQAKRQKLMEDFRANCRDAFATRRQNPQEWNSCLSALFKKEFGGFDELPADALEFN